MFEHPWFFVLLALLPLLAWRLWKRGRNAAVPFSSTAVIGQLRPTLRQRFSWLPSALTLLALALLIVALARPREGRDQAFVESEGIAIEVVVDRSGSMQAMDFQIEGEHVNRLTAIKNVVAPFVMGDSESDQDRGLEGRTTDLVGLVSFAGYADAITPPTLDHHYLIAQLNELDIAERREDGTAIGDAISLAVEKLTSLDERRDDEVKSKVVILLTDGENNAGEFDPIQAAELADKFGIRIYTIGVGTRGQAPFPVRNRLTGRQAIRWMDVTIDEDTLRKIAAETGGKYFRATDTDSLVEIYREIDELEKTKIESKHYVDYRELAVQPIQWGAWSIPPLVLPAILLVAARVLLANLVFRTFA
jgi:Ca-activated chloride channel family protein